MRGVARLSVRGGRPAAGSPWSSRPARAGSGAGLTEYADLTNVSSTSSRVTTEFSVDKLYAGTAEGIYVAAVGRQIGSDFYAARIVIAPDGSVKLYLLRDTSALAAAYPVPGLTIVPNTHYKLSVLVSGTSPTSVSAKVWKASDTEPDWQKTATNTFAALQAPGRVGLFAYLPSGTPNAPVTVSFYNLVAATS